MLSWDDFRYVKAIADTRSLAGAAEALGVNHSTVFRRLGQIEQQLGSRLFERGRAGYALTTCGEQMVELAERMDEDIITFERKVTGQDLRPSGELRVTTSDVVLLHLLTDVLVGFRRAYPEIVLDIVVSNQRLNLSKRDADVAVRATYHDPDPLAGSKVARIAWAVFGPAARAANRSIPRATARTTTGSRSPITIAIAKAMKWLKDHVGEKRIVYKVNTMLGLAEAAAGGVGLVLLPCFVGSAVPGLAQLSPPLPELEGELWLLTHPDLRNTARVRAFLDFCADEIAKRRKIIEGRGDTSRDRRGERPWRSGDRLGLPRSAIWCASGNPTSWTQRDRSAVSMNRSRGPVGPLAQGAVGHEWQSLRQALRGTRFADEVAGVRSRRPRPPQRQRRLPARAHAGDAHAAGEVAIGEAEPRHRAAEAALVRAFEIEARLERHALQRGADGLALDPQRSGRQPYRTNRARAADLDACR